MLSTVSLGTFTTSEGIFSGSNKDGSLVVFPSYESKKLAIFYNYDKKSVIGVRYENEQYNNLKQIPTAVKKENVLKGKTFMGYNGYIENGIMADNGNPVITPTVQQQTIPSGYISGATIQAVTNDIDKNIVSKNIVQGVTILGVTGNRGKNAIYEYSDADISLNEVVNEYQYGFIENSSGYYASNNKGIHNSFAYCRVRFIVHNQTDLSISYINSGESNYDYGLFSNLDTDLIADVNNTSTNVYKSCYGQSSTDVKTLIYNQVPVGEHYITIKFRKDGSSSSGNDSLQFKLEGLGNAYEITNMIYGNIEQMQADTTQPLNSYALIYDTTNTKMSSLYKWDGTAWELSEDIKPTNSALMFATIEEMEAYENPSEDQYAIVYGTTYIGTYRYDNNNWIQIGDSTQEQEIMDVLNDVINTTDQYEGKGGTDEQINSVLDDILGE